MQTMCAMTRTAHKMPGGASDTNPIFVENANGCSVGG